MSKWKNAELFGSRVRLEDITVVEGDRIIMQWARATVMGMLLGMGILTGCVVGERVEPLVLEHEEAAFDIELKYGVHQKNAINTAAQQVVKDLQNGEVAVLNHFQFSDEERRQIYQEIMQTNAMEEDKQLTTECNMKPHASYDLTVTVSDKSKRFAWSQCDKGEDGMEMTRLAQFIIELLRQREEYQQLPAVQGGYQ
ncbi:hypothetical protein JCM10914A_13280 [Paenibacillus sp. JCM 10914]